MDRIIIYPQYNQKATFFYIKITNIHSCLIKNNRRRLETGSFDRYSIEAKSATKLEAVISRMNIPVTPGAKYTISFDVKAPAKATFRLRVISGRKTLKNVTVTASSDQWNQGQAVFTVPKDAEKVTMYIYIADAPAGGFIDNIVLTRQ